MIKPNELRIGNVIGWRTGFGSLVSGPVYEVHPDKVAISQETPIDNDGTGQSFIKLNGIEPIPLTPEWLKRLGFEWKVSIHRWVHSSGYRVVQHNTGFDNGLGDGSFVQPPLKFVHQLQNLYFALTGEELTIQP